MASFCTSPCIRKMIHNVKVCSMKKLLFISAFSACILMYACGGNASDDKSASASNEAGSSGSGEAGSAYDTARGEGKFKNVTVSPTVDNTLAGEGQKVYDVK